MVSPYLVELAWSDNVDKTELSGFVSISLPIFTPLMYVLLPLLFIVLLLDLKEVCTVLDVSIFFR